MLQKNDRRQKRGRPQASPSESKKFLHRPPRHDARHYCLMLVMVLDIWSAAWITLEFIS